MRKNLYVWFALLTTISLTPTVYAASFSCQNAANKTEKAICKNLALNDADVKLATTYTFVLHALPMGGRDTEKGNQYRWLKVRNQCGSNMTCIAKHYKDRQSELDLLIQKRILSQGPF